MSYLGSKAASGAWQVITAMMPPHDTYIETHLGSGVVMARKPPAARSIACELDASILDAFDYAGQLERHATRAESFLDGFDYARSGRVLVYADPPYLHSTRTSSKRYRYEYTERDHIHLLTLLRGIPAYVMLSGYPSALYDRLLPDWRTYEFQAMTRGGVRTEKLWMNFSDGAAHWSSLAGTDFTDRQRIKRKAARWASKYAALPKAERQAVLAALLASDRA